MNPNRPARLNRAVLTLLGLIALAVGVFVVLAGAGILAVLLPIPVRADVPLLPVNPNVPGWGPWVGAAAAVVVGLLALRWLIAQTIRRPAGSDWQLAADTHIGTTRINSDTAAEPLAQEITDYPGVQSATARLTGPRQHPHLYVRVTADDRADISALRHRIGNDAIPRLVQALNLPALAADVLLRLDTAGSARRTR